jgi:hypothetical protein
VQVTRRRVLVADDNATAADSLALILTLRVYPILMGSSLPISCLLLSTTMLGNPSGCGFDYHNANTLCCF